VGSSHPDQRQASDGPGQATVSPIVDLVKAGPQATDHGGWLRAISTRAGLEAQQLAESGALDLPFHESVRRSGQERSPTVMDGGR